MPILQVHCRSVLETKVCFVTKIQHLNQMFIIPEPIIIIIRKPWSLILFLLQIPALTPQTS